MSDDFDHYYDATVRLTKENEKLAGLLRECQTADCNSQFPLKLDHNKIDAAIAAYDEGRT